MFNRSIPGFWRAALTVGGLGTVGAFVFWSLYSKWLELPLFEKISGEQTFFIMILFLLLVFFSLISLLFTHFKSKQIGHNKSTEQDHGRLVKNWDDHPPSKISVVDTSIEQKDYTTDIDIKLRNPSEGVAFIKAVEIKIIKHYDFQMWERPSAVPVEATYDVNLPAKSGAIVRKSLSQVVPANSVDRFAIKLATDHSKYPYTGLSVFFIEIRLIFNENDAEVNLGRFFVHIPPKWNSKDYSVPDRIARWSSLTSKFPTIFLAKYKKAYISTAISLPHWSHGETQIFPEFQIDRLCKIKS